MFEIITAKRLFASNLVINIIVAALLGTTAFAYGCVYAAIQSVRQAETMAGNIADAVGVYYFEPMSFDASARYEIVNGLSDVKAVCYCANTSALSQGRNVNLCIVSEDLYAAAPLPLADGNWLSEDVETINVVATPNTGYEVGSNIEISIAQQSYALRIAGITESNSQIYRFNGFTEPMTFASLFTEYENPTVIVNSAYLPQELVLRYLKPSAVVIVFNDNISEENYLRQINTLKSMGNAYTLDELRQNSELRAAEYRKLFLPCVIILSLVALSSSAAAILITLERSERLLFIVKLTGASPAVTTKALAIFSTALAAVAAIFALLLTAALQSALELKGKAADTGFALSLVIILAIYAVIQSAMIFIYNKKSLKELELGGEK